ncbi:unnamed protein product [Rotaria sp. Silwood1]|nr:unnamed protein product [Rotaria sp. Silwood1]
MLRFYSKFETEQNCVQALEMITMPTHFAIRNFGWILSYATRIRIDIETSLSASCPISSWNPQPNGAERFLF